MTNFSVTDQKLEQILKETPLLPIFGIEKTENVIPTVQALVDGGVKAVEFTFRFPNACEVIKITKEAFPGLSVGAGTVFTLDDANKAFDAGADFIVSPGFNKEVSDACEEKGIPYLACATTATEVMTLLMSNHKIIKFFPAEDIGGIDLMNGLLKAYPDIYFFATGNVRREHIGKYLSHPHVLGLSGSFITPKKMIIEQDLEGLQKNIEDLALEVKNIF